MVDARPDDDVIGENPDSDEISDRKTERSRAYNEIESAINVLHQKWPAAFPVNPYKVRPLALRIGQAVKAELGWSTAYTAVVINIWKARTAYCRAVIEYETRYHLDGSPAEPVNEEARAMARERLKERAIRLARKKREANARAMNDANAASPENGVPIAPPTTIEIALPQQKAAVVATITLAQVKPPKVVPKEPDVAVMERPLSAAKERDRAFKVKLAQMAKKKRRA